MILFKFSNIQDETNNYHQSTALPCSSLQLIAEQEWMREMVTTTKAKRKLRCIIMRCTREDALERRSFGFRASCWRKRLVLPKLPRAHPAFTSSKARQLASEQREQACWDVPARYRRRCPTLEYYTDLFPSTSTRSAEKPWVQSVASNAAIVVCPSLKIFLLLCLATELNSWHVLKYLPLWWRWKDTKLGQDKCSKAKSEYRHFNTNYHEKQNRGVLNCCARDSLSNKGDGEERGRGERRHTPSAGWYATASVVWRGRNWAGKPRWWRR